MSATTDRRRTRPLSPEEQQFFVAIARFGALDGAVDDMEALATRIVDWETVLVHAQDHHLLPLCYWALEKSASLHTLPAATRGHLRGTYMGSLAHNMMLYAELRRIARSFTANGLTLMPLKGAALAERVYPNVGLRPMRDLDLLIRSEELDQAEAILISLGYRVEAHSEMATWWQHLRMARSFVLNRPGHPLFVDVKTALFMDAMVNLDYLGRAGFARMQAATEEIWRNAPTLPIGGTPLPAMTTADLILHVASHSVGQHSQLRCIWLRDLLGLLQPAERDVDWPPLMARAQHLDLEGPLTYALQRVSQELAVTLPAAATDAISALPMRPADRAFYSHLLAIPLTAQPGDSAQHYGLLRFLRSATPPHEKVRLLLRSLFPDPPFMRRRYGINAPLLLLVYYIARPLLLAYQGLLTFTQLALPHSRKGRAS